MTLHVVRETETGIERSRTTVSVPWKEYFEIIVTCMCVTVDGVLDWILNLLTTLLHSSELRTSNSAFAGNRIPITRLPIRSLITKIPRLGGFKLYY
jgi:hypothetical protein